MWDKQAVLSFVKYNKTSIWGTHDDQGKKEEKGKEEKKIGGKKACESDANEGRKDGRKDGTKDGRWEETETIGHVAMWDGMCGMCGMCAAWDLYVGGTRRNIPQVSNGF